MIEIEQFNAERNAALSSLDEQTIRRFFEKFNGHRGPLNDEVFWGSVHKAITGINSLPLELRKNSKSWLDKHGFKSLDDGDL